MTTFSQNQTMDNYLDNYWEEYYEEEIIEDDALWDIEGIENSGEYGSSNRGHPYDETTMIYSESEFSYEEEKTEIVPTQRRDPPVSYPHQLQPVAQSTLPKTQTVRSSDTTAAEQSTRMLPAEEPSSVSRSGILAHSSSSEQPSPASSRNGSRVLLPQPIDPSVVDVEEDYVFSETRIVQYNGNAIVPCNDQHGEAKTMERKGGSHIWGCPLFLCFLVSLLAIVLLILYFAFFSHFFFWGHSNGDPTNLPSATSLPSLEIPFDSFDPMVTCSGRVTTLTDATVAKYDMMVNSVVPTLYSTWDHSLDSCHPANQALLWMSTGSTESESASLERYITALLYFATEGFEWKSQEKWLSHEDICNWEGIGCDSDGELLKLNMQNNGLKGPLISEIGHLARLQVLNLQSNALSGSLPAEVAGLKDLNIVDLSKNRLIGTIPSQIGEDASSLELLKLNGNSLSGAIVSELGRATNLKELDLGQNNFRAELPTELNLLSKLRFLNLDNNAEITGRIPTEYGTFTDLSFFSISNTAIRARIPSQYEALTKLEELHMANTLVGGDIPPAIANMTSLRHLDLSASRFRKPIPTILGTLSKLTHLSFANNSLTGEIPSEIGLLSNLTFLSLEDNILSGSVPSELGLMSNLESLLLHHNFLTGRIADNVCSLRAAELETFTVPCPTRTDDGEQLGITCAVPTCCSSCIGPLELSLRP